MHELSLSQSAVEEIEKIMITEKATQVHRVVFSIGALSGVESEQLIFCFPLAAKDTPVEGTQVSVRTVPLTLVCKSCGFGGQSDDTIAYCPSCKSMDVEVKEGCDFKLVELEIE